MVRRTLQILGFTLVGLTASLAVLTGAELLLRLFGVGGDHARRDPFAGFSHAVPLFVKGERADGVAVYHPTAGRFLAAIGRPLEEAQREFLIEKRSGTFRAFVLGDSSAAGVPYGTSYAFSAWLARRLTAALPSRPIEIVNAAVPGYASRRLMIVNEEVLGYHPDLIIVYVGHNEYAERRYYRHLMDLDPRLFRLRELVAGTRLWAVLAGLSQSRGGSDQPPQFNWVDTGTDTREMFAVLNPRLRGEQYATPRERAYMEIMYESNLTAIVRTARSAGVPVMLVTQSQNFSDWAPCASTHRPDLAPGDLARWDELVEDGNRFAEHGDCAAAVARYEGALAVDDVHADLHYRAASCLRALGRFPAAREHYRRASDLDQVPCGAPLRFNEIARKVAAAEGALLADAEAALSQASEHGLVGDDLFCDWAHPNLRAQQVIAAAIETELRRAEMPVAAASWQTGYTDPATEQLYAENPKLRFDEWLEQMGMCLLARRADCALRSVDQAVMADPHETKWHIARRRVLQTMAGWQ